METLFPKGWWLFNGVADKGRDELMARAKIVKHAPGSVIFLEGDNSQDLFYIAAGRCEIWKKHTGPDRPFSKANWKKHSTFANSLPAGHCFGGLSSLAGEDRTTTAIAGDIPDAVTNEDELTRLIQIAKADFLEVGNRYPRIFQNVMEELCFRAVCSREIEHSLIHCKKEARLIDYLLTMAREVPFHLGEPTITLKVTTALGKSLDVDDSYIRDTLLPKLQEKGVITREGEFCTLHLDEMKKYEGGAYRMRADALLRHKYDLRG